MQEIAGRGGTKAKVCSVLLLTDGLANVGHTSKDAILQEMKKIRVSFCPRSQHLLNKSEKLTVINFLSSWKRYMQLQEHIGEE